MMDIKCQDNVIYGISKPTGTITRCQGTINIGLCISRTLSYGDTFYHILYILVSYQFSYVYVSLHNLSIKSIQFDNVYTCVFLIIK